MPNNKISLKLDGIVPLELYNQAVGHFTALVMALTAEISGVNSIQWTVTELRAGSTFSEITGYADPIENVERVAAGVKIVGISLQTRQMIPYSDAVEREALGLTSILNGKVTALHLGIDDDVIATVNEPIEYEQQKKLDIRDFGAVEGVVSAINDRPNLIIGLYDDVFGKRIDCTLDAELTERVREVWRKRVRITGMVKRSPETGLALSVREVTNIEEMSPHTAGGFLNALGILGRNAGDEKPEMLVRRMRDGG